MYTKTPLFIADIYSFTTLIVYLDVSINKTKLHRYEEVLASRAIHPRRDLTSLCGTSDSCLCYNRRCMQTSLTLAIFYIQGTLGGRSRVCNCCTWVHSSLPKAHTSSRMTCYHLLLNGLELRRSCLTVFHIHAEVEHCDGLSRCTHGHSSRVNHSLSLVCGF